MTIQLQGVPWLYNTSYYQQMTQLASPGHRSPKKDNGAVLFADVKPVTDYDRYFLRDFTSVHSGHNRSAHADGSTYGAAFVQQFLPTGGRHQLYLPYNAGWYNPASTLSVLYGAPPSIDDWAVLRGQLAARAKTLGFDASTFLAERRKTAAYLQSAIPKFLRSSMRVVQNTARASHRNSAKHGGRAIDNVGDEWLAARYGLRPLLYDIENAIKAYEIGLGGFLRAFSNESKAPVVSTLPSWSVPSALFMDNKSVQLNPYAISGSTRCDIVTDYSCHGSAGIGSLLNAAVTFNPSLTALELVPFSFIVGWICNIPEQLIAHAPVFDRQVLYYCLAMKRSKTFVFRSTWKGNAGYKYYINGNSGLVAQGYHQVDAVQTTTAVTDVFYRRRISPTDIPWVMATSFNLSALQLADLAALAKQLVNSIRRI